MKHPLLILCLIAFLFTQCTKDDPVITPVGELENKDDGRLDSDIADFGDSNNELAFDLFHEVISHSNEPGENVTISPLSVHTALLMALNGADNATYDAIASTVHSGSFAESSINNSYRAYEDYVAAQPTTELNISNAVFWDQARITPYDFFTQKMDDSYQAELNALIFKDPAALATINGWVDNATNGRISKIMDEIKPEEVLFLINALYFKGRLGQCFQ